MAALSHSPRNSETCYMCAAPATSKEHVPPRCIFPRDPSYRKEFVRVPSCDKHNSEKSKNDEYLRFVLSAVGGTNELAHGVFGGAVMRSLDHRRSLINNFVPGLEAITVGEVETGSFRLNWQRFQTAVDSIVRGLYFYETGKKLDCEITGAAWQPMLINNYSKALFFEAISRAECECPLVCQGANPRVFQYGFGKSGTGKTSFCRLRFYEGYPIYVTWRNYAEGT